MLQFFILYLLATVYGQQSFGEEELQAIIKEIFQAPGFQDKITQEKSGGTVRPSCGLRNPNGVGLSNNGDTDSGAKFGEFPWMVALLRKEPIDLNSTDGKELVIYVGGGSLIHPSVVLTAAHSVVKWTKLVVRAGEWDSQVKNEKYPHQDRDVREVVVHDKFNQGNFFFDIALLFLDTAMDLSLPHIGVVCLPPNLDRAFDGTLCQVSGWGKNHYGPEGQYQVKLKRVEVPVVNRKSCQAQLRMTRLGRYFELHSSFMCAGGEVGKDTCQGDGGSPLVCLDPNNENVYLQYGIVSWGIGCGRDGVPAVYTDVSIFRTWVNEKMREHGYDTQTYSAEIVKNMF